jgi:hypothetical protein
MAVKSQTNEKISDLESKIKNFYLHDFLQEKPEVKEVARVFNPIRDFIKKPLRWLKNHSYYTVCMKNYEESKGLFRICTNKIEGMKCYDELNIEELWRIEVNGNDYLICPKAIRFWDREDFEKYRLKNRNQILR